MWYTHTVEYYLAIKSSEVLIHTTTWMKLFFLNLFLTALGLCCCARAFSSCGEQGLLSVAVRGSVIAVASLVAEQAALGTQASVVAAHGLRSCGSWA